MSEFIGTTGSTHARRQHSKSSSLANAQLIGKILGERYRVEITRPDFALVYCENDVRLGIDLSRVNTGEQFNERDFLKLFKENMLYHAFTPNNYKVFDELNEIVKNYESTLNERAALESALQVPQNKPSIKFKM